MLNPDLQLFLVYSHAITLKTGVKSERVACLIKLSRAEARVAGKSLRRVTYA